MNKIQSAPIPSFHSALLQCLHCCLPLTHSPSTVVCLLFSYFPYHSCCSFFCPHSSMHLSFPLSHFQFLLCCSSGIFAMIILLFFTYLFLPLPPHLPQREVRSPPGSRYSTGTGCWSRRGEGWATSGRAGSASCPGWRAGCGHAAWGRAPAGWSPGRSRPLWHSPPGPLGWDPRLPPGPLLTTAGTHWPLGAVDLSSEPSLEEVKKRPVKQRVSKIQI